MKCNIVMKICDFEPEIWRFQNQNIYANFKPGIWPVLSSNTVISNSECVK